MADDIDNRNSGLNATGTPQRVDRFNIETHEVMLDEAFVGSIFPKEAVRQMRFGIGFWSDVVLSMKESVHLDNHRGNDVLVKAYKEAIEGFHRHTEKKQWVRAGVCLHTIGDFYAHSNFIDIYSLYAQQNGLSLEKEDIPTFSTLMDDEAFLAFAREQGELRTGTYGLVGDIVEKVFRTKPKEGSHTLMNLDSNKSYNGGQPLAPGTDPVTGRAYCTKHEAAVRVSYEECHALLLQQL